MEEITSQNIENDTLAIETPPLELAPDSTDEPENNWGAPYTTFDKHHRLVKEYSVPVTQYSGFHYIPFVHGIQLKYNTLDFLFIEDCGTTQLIKNALDEVQEFFDEMLPYSEKVAGFVSPSDAMFSKENLSTSTVSISSMVDKSRGTFLKTFPKLKPLFKKLQDGTNMTETEFRTKIIAPLLVAGIISLIVSTGWSIYQQVQVQELSNNVNKFNSKHRSIGHTF